MRLSRRPFHTSRMNSVSLPRLPIPDLRHTLDRYLASIEPILLQDEAKGGPPYHSAYALRVKWANDFENGIGKVLQDRLHALDKASPNNWLEDNFWIYKAYLEWRAPLLINSNWWLAFHDDNLVPERARGAETNDTWAGITPWQIRRAAWLLYRVLDFKGKLDSQELHPDTTRTGVWFRWSASKMFNIARIPQPCCDVLSQPADPSTDPAARKILLMVHNWFYTITVYHPPDSPSSLPRLMGPGEMEAQIRAVVLDVERRLASGETAVPIGILSADDRDQWAKNLSYLLSLSQTNKETYQTLLQCLMGLSLEHTTHVLPPGPSLDPEQQRLDAHLHTIRGTPLNAANRFYDKPFTLIVDPSTQAGATGEHSPCDALVPSIVAEYGIVQGVDVNAFSNSFAAATGWERLVWVTDDKILNDCTAAEESASKLMKDSDDSVLWFKEYGTDWIKSHAGFPFDAYIQMCLQLAWYSTRGDFTATYETVLTRMFKHGRTETLRTLTRESRDWVLSMRKPQFTSSERYLLLQRAIKKHVKLTRETATGRGIDRHLLGLQLMLRPLNGERASLLDDELFKCSARWALSTSGLSAGHLFKGTGFGTVFHDGYGINYLAAPTIIKFGIESKLSCPHTSTLVFQEVITSTLLEMRDLCMQATLNNSDTQTISHL
ncbi:hypothetical protein M378DRAFT_122548 [Amanita muscaria Koide BX008]|uniref:Choline/carnitine acyltransferase domain-containing protein n=1 Tax=Amanita muscaria (strain Koide BX008) TaxID=946122 RepID=A0A0C2TKM2_AMAMK|nr:hypothetical protein M378DRAFT_122548 [Amanita muscaria Koide BX008]